MTITLYNTYDENNRLVKRFTQDTIEIEGNLRDSTDVLSPTIIIEYNKFPMFNYAFIPEFGRYYYIIGIEAVRTHLWSLTMSVDVLNTYSNSILNQKAFVSRSESNYNVGIVDPKFPTQAFSHFNYGNPIEDDVTSPFRDLREDAPNYRYALTVIGDIDYINQSEYNPELSMPFEYATYKTNMCRTYIFSNYETLLEIVDLLQDPEQYQFPLFKEDPTQYIISLKVFPFNLYDLIPSYELPRVRSGDTSVPAMRIGNYNLFVPDGYQARLVITDGRPQYCGKFSFKGIEVFSNSLTDWVWFTSTSPTAKLQLYVPFFGTFNIEPEVAFDGDKCAYLYLSVDVVSGIGTIYLSKDKLSPHDSTSVFYTASNDVSYSIPIGRNNSFEVARNNIIKGLNFVVDVAALFITGGKTKMVSTTTSRRTNPSFTKTTKEKPFWSKGRLKITKRETTEYEDDTQTTSKRVSVRDNNRLGIPQFYTNESPNFSMGGIGTWDSAVNSNPKPYYTISCPKTSLHSYENWIQYLHQYGGMLCDMRTLRDLHGYTEVDSVHLEHIISNNSVCYATSTELEDIEENLKNGVILPYENE